MTVPSNDGRQPIKSRFDIHIIWLLVGAVANLSPAYAEKSLADTLGIIKPGIVGVGTYQNTRSPAVDFKGTGFVVMDGLHVLTNIHVLPSTLDTAKLEMLAVFVREGEKEMVRAAEVTEKDAEHDLALLTISGPPLPSLSLGNSDKVREGEVYAFTGYPIGVVLGLHPATHRGMISAITPVAIPVPQARQLNKLLYERLQTPYKVFQLDATAYPGNSGSPLYDTETGEVVGIINKVFVQESKESLLAKPSGITYAIPIRHAVELLKKNAPK